MALYRCAACGSSNVVQETKQEGYNKKKGIFGMALFGIGGAVAGTDGNTVVYYHCAACGQTINRCMSEVDKKFIEKYLLDPTDAASINRLREYKKQYPNIEWEEPAAININQVNTNKENLEKIDIFDVGKAILDALYQTQMPCAIAEMQMLDKSCNEYSIAQLSIVAKYLVKVNIIEESVQNNETCYKTIFSSEKEALLLLHRMETKKLQQKRGQEQKAKDKVLLDNLSIALAIINSLYKTEKPCTISEIQMLDETCKKCTNDKLTAIAKALVDKNIIEKIIKNYKYYFKTSSKSKDEAIQMLYKE